MIIRKAQPSDAASILLLMNEGFGWENNKPISSTFFNRDHIFCMLAVNDENEVMGMASLHILEKINRRSALVEDVVVFKKYRGNSVGKKIIEQLIEISKEKNCYKIILNTQEENISYYEKLGFIKKQLQMEIRLN